MSAPTTVTLTIPDFAPDADTLTVALQLAAAGIYVLPCVHGTKDPGSILGRNWQSKSSRDPEQIIAWFAATNWELMIHCGRSGLLVVDVDTPDQLPNFIRDHLPLAPFQSTRVDVPERGHAIFAMPPGRLFGNSLGRLPKGWGEIRGLNGVVKCFPSSHDTEGGRYFWERAGLVPFLPDELTEKLDDASPSDDAATDAQVSEFLVKHVDEMRTGLLAGLTKALASRYKSGESRHQSTVPVLTGAMKEAKAGYYPAHRAVECIREMFLDAVAKPPVTNKQTAARTGHRAEAEFDGILAWAVGQANATNVVDIKARVEQKVPSPNGSTPTPPDPGASQSSTPPPGPGTTAPPPPTPHTWEPIDPDPWLNGTVVVPKPTLGIARSDGVRLVYPGREHAFLGETESGKSWLALGCVVAELIQGHRVVYVHYEEGDPGSTYERLGLLGIPHVLIRSHLTFVAPDQSPRHEWVENLCLLKPTLVVHDGVNEAMATMGAEMNTDGASEFRRRLVTPFLKAGAASIACDHLPMNPAPGRVNAYGTVHKGNVLNGARIQLENTEPFGRDMRGVSHVFVTKDRPGHLRTKGKATKVPGKTYMGTLVVDDEPVFTPFSMMFYAPKDAADAPVADPADALAANVHDVIWRQADHKVMSLRSLGGLMRLTGERASHAKIRDAADELVAAGKLIEISGPRNSTGYQAVTAP